MLGPETFLTELYVLVDDFCNARLPPEAGPGPAAALSRSEAVTLAVFGQWGRFASERGWWRFADARLRPLFPRLPDRAQLTRRVRRLGGAIAAFGLWLAEGLGALGQPYEALDSTAAPTRRASITHDPDTPPPAE